MGCKQGRTGLGVRARGADVNYGGGALVHRFVVHLHQWPLWKVPHADADTIPGLPGGGMALASLRQQCGSAIHHHRAPTPLPTQVNKQRMGHGCRVFTQF